MTVQCAALCVACAADELCVVYVSTDHRLHKLGIITKHINTSVDIDDLILKRNKMKMESKE